MIMDYGMITLIMITLIMEHKIYGLFMQICRDAPDKLSGRIIRPDSRFFHYPVSGRIASTIRPDSRIFFNFNFMFIIAQFLSSPSCLLLLRRVRDEMLLQS